MLHFRYAQVGIRSLLSEIYLQKPDAIAGALAVLMKHRKAKQAEIKLAALRKIIESDLTEGERLFLISFVETYLPAGKVPVAAEEIMQKLAEIETNWVERALTEGEQKGKQEGRQEGRQEAKHEILLLLLTKKFGPLSAEFKVKVNAITDEQSLDQLIEQALFADSLVKIKLPARKDQA